MTEPDFAELPPATAVARAGEWSGAYDLVVLTYDERFLHRRRLETPHDETFVVNLAQTTQVDHGDALVLEDGRLIEVIAAEEPLVEISGPHLTLVAWHIGSRHMPCRIEADRLLIRPDPVLQAMLAQLGATQRPVTEPFTPVGAGHAVAHGHAHHHDAASPKPAIISRTGRVQPVQAEPLPEGGPFGDGS